MKARGDADEHEDCSHSREAGNPGERFPASTSLVRRAPSRPLGGWSGCGVGEYLGEETRAEAEIAGITAHDGTGLGGNVDGHSIPHMERTIQPERLPCACQCPWAAENLYHQQGVEIVVSRKDDAGGPAIVLQRTHPSWRVQDDIMRRDIKSDLLADIQRVGPDGECAVEKREGGTVGHACAVSHPLWL